MQALRFATQYIGRRIEHLPVANLEAFMLAYTVITVAMYIAWWEKLLNIRRAINALTHTKGKEGTEGRIVLQIGGGLATQSASGRKYRKRPPSKGTGIRYPRFYRLSHGRGSSSVSLTDKPTT